MNILVTAGSTMVMIDKVRSLGNIFKGRTGAAIAEHFLALEHKVTLLTSSDNSSIYANLQVLKYKTYDDLYNGMKELITGEYFDVIVHSSAVSDYRIDGVYECGIRGLEKIDSSGKVGSDKKELFLKLIPTEKIVDRIRDSWGFKGKLVKFKLQVGMSDEDLIEIAKKSREHSKADVIVANCLEWCKDRAYVITSNSVNSVRREILPYELSFSLGL